MWVRCASLISHQARLAVNSMIARVKVQMHFCFACSTTSKGSPGQKAAPLSLQSGLRPALKGMLHAVH
jgi:hypothetical protein